MNALNCLKPTEKSFSCAVELLDGTSLNLTYTSSERGSVLQQRVWRHIDLLEKEYFGLRFLNSHSNVYCWLDGRNGITKQIKGVFDANGLKLYMGVKFYSPRPNELIEEITRYQFYLQLRRDVYSGCLTLPFSVLAQVSALVAQGELGDYSSVDEENGYPVELKLTRKPTAEFDAAVSKIHPTLRGLEARECEARYLNLVSKQELYGIQFHHVKGSGDSDYKLSLSSDGIVIYKQNTKASLYLWKRIESIRYKKRDFIIQVYNKKSTELLTLILTCAIKTECKQLWKLAVEHHTFFRLQNVSEISQGVGDQAMTLPKDHEALSLVREPGLEKRSEVHRNSARVPPSVQRSNSLKSQSKFKTTGCQTGDCLMLADPTDEEYGQKEKGLFSSGKTSSSSTHCLKLKFDGTKRSSVSNRSTCGNCSRSDDSGSQLSKPRSQGTARRRTPRDGNRRKSSCAPDTVEYRSELRSPTGFSADSYSRVTTSLEDPGSSAAHYIKQIYHRRSARSLRNYENIVYSSQGAPMILSSPANKKITSYQQSWLQPDSSFISTNNSSNYQNSGGLRQLLPLDRLPDNKPIAAKDNMTFYEEKVQGRDSGTDSPTGQFSPTVTGKLYGHQSDRDYHNQTLFYYALRSSGLDTAI